MAVLNRFLAAAIFFSFASVSQATEFGVATKFAQGMPAKFAGEIVNAGVNINRDGIPWNFIEKVKGQLAVGPIMKKDFDALAANHVRTIFVLTGGSGGNKFYDNGEFPTSEEAIAGFARYAAFMATTFKDQAVAFELWNEWKSSPVSRSPTGMSTHADYIKLFKATSIAIHQANPAAIVIADPAILSGVPLRRYDAIQSKEWPATWAKIQNSKAALTQVLPYVDGFVVHFYPYQGKNFDTHEAALLDDMKTTYTKMSALKGKPVPIYVTEFGWPVIVGRALNEDQQSQHIIASMNNLNNLGFVKAAIYYELSDSCGDLTYSECTFGLLRYSKEHTARPARDAFKKEVLRIAITNAPAKSIDMQKLAIVNTLGSRANGGSIVTKESIRVLGSTNVHTAYDYNIVSDTVIEFDVVRGSIAEVYSIGLMPGVFNGSMFMNKYSIQFDGTQKFGKQNRVDLLNGQTMHIVIPVGKFYTGMMKNLVIMADDDKFKKADITLSNLQIHEKVNK